MFENLVCVYVEDDRLSRDVMTIFLKHLKISHYTIFVNSENFIEKVQALDPKPNLFLLDIHVQPHTGFEMLTMLRNHPDFKTAIVTALTASVMSDEVQQLKTAGFDGVISKPIDPDRLPQIFQMLLRGEKVWRVIG